MTDTTEIVRALTGVFALLTAGGQLVLRKGILDAYPDQPRAWIQKEKAAAFASFLLLSGVGIANLTHLHAPLSTSTFIISLGILAQVFLAWRIYLWGEEEMRIAAALEDHVSEQEGRVEE